MASTFHVETHKTLSSTVEDYHRTLNEIDAEMRQLAQKRTLIKATALAELTDQASALKLSKEALGHLSVACW